MAEIFKQCATCKEWLPATSDYFHKRGDRRKNPWKGSCKKCLNKLPVVKVSDLVALEGYKICRQCRKEKPATKEYFNNRKRSADGIASHCKECVFGQRQKYRQENRDEIKQKKKTYYTQNKEDILQDRKRRYWTDPDKHRAVNRQRYILGRDKMLAYAEKYRNENRPRIQASQRAYYRRNRQSRLAANREYRTKHSERLREQNKRWREANRAKISEKGRQYRSENQDKILAYLKNYRAANPEKLRYLNARYRQLNRDELRAKNKAWQSANADRVKNKNLAYRQQKRDEINAKIRVWRKSNPEKVRIKEHRRRARKRSLPDTLAADQWQSALDYFGGCCAYCGRPAGLFHTMAIEHFVPLSNPSCPGTTALNCLPACHGQLGCNNQKSNKPAAAWLESKFGKRKAAKILARINAYFDHVRTNPT